jgi:spore coat polysaccharide biosynthesis protein SpsF
MSILLVVQAGHDGTDRRDRQLTQFAGRTVLDIALQRLSGFTEGPLIVAVSDLPADQEIEEIARANDAATVRGPSDDMLARFVEVIADYPAEHLVRVTADSPFLDHELVSSVVATHLATGADYTSNTLLRTHPQGLEVEVIRSDALLDAAEQATGDSERSGVTTFVQRRPANYNLQAVLAPGDYEDHDWRVSGPASISALTTILNSVGGDVMTPWHDLIAHDKPSLADGTVKLRVARDNVASSLGGLTDGIGHLPDPLPLTDPARRTWGVWTDDSLVGALTVSVQNGWGTLAGQFAPGLATNLADATLHAVDERLLADDQVLALTIDGSRIRQYRD